MKHSLLILLAASAVAAATAQTPAKPAAPAAATQKPAATAAHAATATPGMKIPANIPVVHGIVKTAFTLRYEDIKLGTGADAEPGKLFKVKYTGYRWADGVKFDSTDDHRRPVLDKDGKPVNGPDGKPQLGEAEPMAFPQGMGRLIPGFDQGFAGMKVGGKRRIFIPWQLAYGTREIPERSADHPGIPAKSDLIFDVELVDVTDLPARPMPPNRPVPPGSARPGAPPAPGAAPAPGSAPAPATPGASPTAPPPGAGANPPTTSQPSTPPPPTTTPQSVSPPPATAPTAPANPPQTPTPPQTHAN